MEFLINIYFIYTHTHTHRHTYCGQAHVLAIHSISDTDMTTGISKDIHADINIGVHTDTHTHRGKWQKKKKKNEKTCAIQCRSNNRFHTQSS